VISEVLERIAAALSAARIPYMVIGGQAVLVHGEPRLTRDIDVTLGVTLDRLTDIVAAAAAAGLEPLVDPQTFTRETRVLPCADAKSGVRVDIVLSDSNFERAAIDRAVTVRLGSTDVRFVTPEDLIVHRVVAGRPRDLEDVRSIVARQPRLDRQRVEQALREFEPLLEAPLLERWRQAAETS
jgi:hypothetical protein